MESNENNNLNSPEEEKEKEEEETQNTDDGPAATASLSTSPKRCKLDPDAPSTSNLLECITNLVKSSDKINDIDDEDDDDDDDEEEDNASSQNVRTDKKTKSISIRIAKRNYRRRSDSQSSTNSVTTPPMLPIPEQSNENNRNNREDTPDSQPFVSLLDDDSTFSSDDDDSSEESESSDTESDDSTEYEEKAQVLLNKPAPKCDLNLLKNLVYRQSGLIYNGERRTYDSLATGLINRIGSSIYSVERMKQLHTLDKHFGCVNCLNFNKAGNLIVTGSDDLKVIVWDWAQEKSIIIQHSGHRSNVFQSKFVDNGSASNQKDFHLITSARDGEVRSIQVAPDGTAKVRVVTRHANDAVHKIVMPDANEVLTAGEDGCVMRSDLRDAKSPKTLLQVTDKDEKIPLYSIAHHPFDPEFCICGRDKFVRVYDKRNTKECSKMFCPDHILKRTKRTSPNITCAVYNYNGSEVLASYGDENIYLFDTADHTPGRYKHTYYGHKNQQTIKGVNFFGAHSEFVMSGSDCGNFFMWDKNSESIVQWLPGDESGVVNCLEGHPHFPIIATSGLDHDVKIWYPINANGRPSQIELKKCIKSNLTNQDERFLRTHFRSMTRILNGRFPRSGQSNSDDDSSDSDDEDDGLRTFYRPDRGPCEVQ